MKARTLGARKRALAKTALTGTSGGDERSSAVSRPPRATSVSPSMASRSVSFAGCMNVKGLLAVTLTALALSLGDVSRLPQGWSTQATLDASQACRAKVVGGGDGAGNRLMIRCGSSHAGVYSVTQSISAEPYRGRRVLLSARIRGQALQGRAGLVLKAETRERRLLAMDDMRLNPVQGDTRWIDARVLLDVDPEADSITLGAAVEAGAGTAWVESVRFDVASPDDVGIAVVVRPEAPALPAQPRNLGFR